MFEDAIEDMSRMDPSTRRADPVAFSCGVASVVLLLCAIALLPLVARARPAPERSALDQPPFEYVEARLLRLGEEKEDDRLPDRIVPALPTAPEETLALDREEDRPEPEPEEERPPRQADATLDDKLREVFDKARAFAEIQDDYVPEGHPDGVPEGDVTDPALASLGATYGHRVKRLFLERWIVPTLLSEDRLEKLRAKVNVEVDIDMVIVDVEFVSRSGEPMFDDSVRSAVDRVRAEVRTLPDPPEAIAPRVFGGGINLTFHGREASYE